MDVQRERVVAARDVAEPLDHAPVVVGVDVRLLAVVGPGMGARRAERDAARRGQGEEPPAPFALVGDRLVQVLAATGDDLDLRRDQLAGDAREEQRVGLGGGVADVLEAGDEIERLRIEQRELLLQAHREVRGRGEHPLHVVEVDGHRDIFRQEAASAALYVR